MAAAPDRQMAALGLAGGPDAPDDPGDTTAPAAGKTVDVKPQFEDDSDVPF